MHAVRHNDETGLLALQELLDDHPMPGGTKGVTSQHVAHGFNGLGLGLRHDHPLARRESISLDHDRCPLRTDVRRSRLDLRERLIGSRGNMVPGHEILTEGFRTLKLRGGLRRAKTGKPGGAEGIHHPQHQRRFRADNRQADAFTLGKADEGIHIIGSNFNIPQTRLQRRAGIAGRDKNGLDMRRLGCLPGQRMFTAAAADDENFHECGLSCCSNLRG